jgi:hypothetical protein
MTRISRRGGPLSQEGRLSTRPQASLKTIRFHCNNRLFLFIAKLRLTRLRRVKQYSLTKKRFRNVSLYLCTQQDSWGKYSRKSAWKVCPAVRARCLRSDTSSQGDLYTRRLSHTAHSSSSLPLVSSRDDQLIHEKATQKKSFSRPVFLGYFRG